MSRFENVLADTDLALDEFAGRIGGIVGSEPERMEDVAGDAYYLIQLGTRTSAILDVADLADERGIPFSRYRYLVEVQSVRDGRRDDQAQMAAARGLYDRLAAETDWPLLLAFRDGAELIAQRDARAAA